jgi:hypothetical protein
MKRKSTLTLVLALLPLLVFAPTARGRQQGGQKAAFDTGVVTLGPGQVLRITVNGQGGNDTVTVGFRRMTYSQGTCDGGVCVTVLDDEARLSLVTLPPGGAASFDIPDTAYGVRGVVLSGSQNVRVTAQIIDTDTGDVIAIWVPQGSPVVGKD